MIVNLGFQQTPEASWKMWRRRYKVVTATLPARARYIGSWTVYVGGLMTRILILWSDDHVTGRDDETYHSDRKCIKCELTRHNFLRFS